jgi:hypothetical protein
MFRSLDVDSLSAINALGRDMRFINFELSFPIKGEYKIPEDIRQLSIFESHMDKGMRGFESFKIYVGKLTTIRRICNSKDNNFIFLGDVLSIAESVDNPLCYYDEEDGTHVVFARPYKGDIVVANTDELRDALEYISKKFRTIKNSSNSIKRMGEKSIRGKLK